jgi:predicted metal-dependent hydrolase
MGVEPNAIKITAAKKRFGSCSGKNSICFSLFLMAYPKEAVDYVVVHELAHIKEKNHGKNFYRFIASVMPDYKYRQSLLK